MNMKQFLICLAFIGFITNASYSQTKIGRAEDSLNKDRGGSNDSDDDDDENGGFFLETFGEIIAQAFFYVGYYTLIGPSDEEEPINNSALTKYPYNNANKGNYTYSLDENYSTFRTEFTGRYISESNSLKGMHLNAEMRFAKRIGVDLDYHQLWEKNPDLGNDHLALYNVMAKYYRVRTEKIELYWGIGTTYVDGEVDRIGLSYGVGSEFFFAKPLSFETNFSQAFINSETINKFNVLLNYHIDQYKVLGGYEYIKIGSERFSSITLGVGVFF